MVLKAVDSEVIRTEKNTRRSELIETDADGTESDISPQMASISATPASPTVVHDTTQQIAVAVVDKFGTTHQVFELCEYTTTNAAIATVDGNGLITGVAAGTCDIKVRYGDLIDTVSVTVT